MILSREGDDGENEIVEKERDRESFDLSSVQDGRQIQ